MLQDAGCDRTCGRETLGGEKVVKEGRTGGEGRVVGGEGVRSRYARVTHTQKKNRMPRRKF